MNLAAAYNAADIALNEARNRIEALLFAICPGWRTWRPIKPDGIEVFGAFDNARGAELLHKFGYVTVIFHDHLIDQIATCRCNVREQPRTG
jgi:hypothetical protein